VSHWLLTRGTPSCPEIKEKYLARLMFNGYNVLAEYFLHFFDEYIWFSNSQFLFNFIDSSLGIDTLEEGLSRDLEISKLFSLFRIYTAIHD